MEQKEKHLQLSHIKLLKPMVEEFTLIIQERKYFACSVSTQYYTRMGIGTISAKAGGATLGR